ncbi:MAG TPA: hypothetical protein VKU80_11520 [Planctomycetota bacterium]|nr:hypothetical protein [Planctomycetota bacterium]
MNATKRLITLMAASAFMLALGACDDGPLEKAGKSIDKAGEKTGDKLKDITR